MNKKSGTSKDAADKLVKGIKQGKSKAAHDRIPPLSRALECDPAYLMPHLAH